MCGKCHRLKVVNNPIIQGVPVICVCGGLLHRMEHWGLGDEDRG